MKRSDTFLKAILKSGSSTIISLAFNIISSKLIALQSGPSGIGLFGIIRQSITALTAPGAAGQTAIVQGISSRIEKEKRAYLVTVLVIYLAGTSITAAILFTVLKTTGITETWLGASFSKAAAYALLAAAVVGNIYFLLKSTLNGYRLIGRLAITEIAGPITLSISVYVITLGEFEDQGLSFAIAFLTSQSAMFATALILILRAGIEFKMTPSSWFTDYNKQSAKHFFSFTFYGIGATLMSTGSLLLIRAYISHQHDLTQTGFFELSWTLSSAYVMILLSAFGTYYLPALSAQPDINQRSELILKTARASVFLSTVLISFVIATKSTLIQLLYSEDFLPAASIVRWMLIGDYLKITAWVFAIPSIAEGKMSLYFKTEAIWWISFTTTSCFLSSISGSIEAIGQVFVITYIPLLLFYLRVTTKANNIKLQVKDYTLWLTGLANIIIASSLTWTKPVPLISYTTSIIALSVIFLSLSANKTEITQTRRFLSNIVQSLKT